MNSMVFFKVSTREKYPILGRAEWQDAMSAWARFQELAKTLPSGYPQSNNHTKKLDSKTFAQWIEENTTTDFGQWYFAYMVRAVGFLWTNPTKSHCCTFFGDKIAPLKLNIQKPN
jgi:monoamine oxidase